MHAKGFVLPMTLGLMFIMTLLLLSAMQQMLLYHRLLNQSEQSHQRFYQLEHIAMQLADIKPDLLNKRCVFSPGDANKAVELLAQGKGCQAEAETAQYRYIFEDLGDFPCLLADFGQQKRITQHRRISVLLVQNQENTSTLLLQIRYIKASDSPARSACTQTARLVATGVSSWRYFSDYLLI